MKYRILSMWAFVIILVACGKKNNAQEPVPVKQQQNWGSSIYYWKTTFRLNNYEKEFLENHQVRKMYLRFFDVTVDNEHAKDPVIPIATLILRSEIPDDLEVVPTVFITNDVMKQADLSVLAHNITKRILTMAETNDIRKIKEIQIDCDWTRTTQINYFSFLSILRQQLLLKSIKLSVTIRLHQLTMAVPPVDNGVLMCYNTGYMRKMQTENSILDLSDVAPYMKGVINYSLPLSVAYPTFSWAVAFRNNEFFALVRQVDIDNTEYYEKINNSIYRVIAEHYQDGKLLQINDILRMEESHFKTIDMVKAVVEEALPMTENREILIYHLDSANLSKYTTHEIEALYNR